MAHAATLQSTGGTELGWRQAFKPSIYLISFLPLLSVLTLFEFDAHRLVALTFAASGVILLQHGVNVLNDLTDWKKGADVEKHDSWVHYHGKKLNEVRTHGVLSLAAGFSVGVLALIQTRHLELLVVALPLVVLGVFYNHGKRPLSYTRHGEWVTALCYGPGVAGCLWYLTESLLSLSAVLLVAAYAGLAVAVLLSHQPPQALTDAMVGKQSFVVRRGVRATYRLAKGLFWGSFAALTLAGMTTPLHFLTIAILFAGLLLIAYRTRGRNLSPPLVLKSAGLWIAAGFVMEAFAKVGG